MPVRATKRGAERTPLHGEYDVIVCGASFAGLTVARALASVPAARRILLLDRYEVGERQTSACAAPTRWLEGLGLGDTVLQTFGELVTHLPRRSFRWRLPFTFSTFDYRALCGTLFAGVPACFETATVTGSTETGSGGGAVTVRTDRGDVSAPLVVDALGWRRVLGSGPTVRPPRARLSRGLEVHPAGAGDDLELWLDPRYVRAGYGWSFPAGDEVRVGWGSFAPRDHVREPTVRLAAAAGRPAEGWQGNWIPHELRPAADGGVFLVGDSAGHCLPLTAEGIRPAFFFALVLARELRAVLEGRRSRAQALQRYAAFSAAHRRAYDALLRLQSLAGATNPTPWLERAVRAMDRPDFVRWSFGRYEDLFPPGCARLDATAAGAPPRARAA